MPARILIVEDNPANLELMSYLLRAFGHDVSVAPNGAAGLAAVGASDFDLILADILMPQMDGFEFVRQVKADPRARPTPVVAVTALAMVGDREKVLAADFDGYIAKPIDPKSFVAAVDAYLTSDYRSKQIDLETAQLPEAARAHPTGRCVLVVDDVAANISVIEAALKSTGHRIVAARSAAEAIRLAEADPPDVVLSDIHMPDADGFDLIRSFKQSAALAHIPFAFLSSTYWHDVDKAHGLALGAAKFLTRPIDPATLLAEVDQLLAGDPDG